MTESLDRYIEDKIRLGDRGSGLLAALTAPTLRNSSYVDIISPGMNSITVLKKLPDDHYIAAFAAGGDPRMTDVALHAASMVDRLVYHAKRIGATPLGFADVIDSNTGNLDMLRTIAGALVERANHYKVPILNGENALLGDRITGDANVSGTMIALIPKHASEVGIFHTPGLSYVVFDHRGQAVYMNSDGIGTKTELYERFLHLLGLSLRDSLAMKLDDAAKIAATVMAVCDYVEMNSSQGIDVLRDAAEQLSKEFGIGYVLTPENVGGRIQSYKPGIPAYNVSGSAVSLIDEERLKNMPSPRAGDTLIALTGVPNPRSNGITAKREAMVRVFGNEWQDNPDANSLGEFLTTPSTIFYPLFKQMLDDGIATSVFHMSGGALYGKLAKPLATHELYVDMEDKLFPPHRCELELAGFDLSSAESSYRKWPMGNEGFVTTTRPDEVIALAVAYGLRAREVGVLQHAYEEKIGDKTIKKIGIEFIACNKETVKFSGLD